MKNAIVGISVGIIATLVGQAFLLSDIASAQAYGESAYGGGIYNDARLHSEDGDRGAPINVESDPSVRAGVPNAPDDQVSDEKDGQLAESAGEALTEDNDRTTDSRAEQSDLDTEGSDGNDWDSPKYMFRLSLGTLVLALLLSWAIVIRRRRERY